MRKIMQRHMMVTLEGFIEGQNGEADWQGAKPVQSKVSG